MNANQFKRDKANLIIFDRLHCKKLLEEDELDEVKKYLQYFFFSYENKVFYFNGTEFILYTREEALKLIPDDLKITYSVANNQTKKFDKVEYSLKQYLKSVEFMQKEFKPTISFSGDLVITKTKRIRGFDFTENLINMAKPLNTDIITGDKFDVTDHIIQATKLINQHIKNVLCSGNDECFEFVLNFIACSFFGRKLRKALYIQSKERTGKGIIMNDVLKKILGDRMCKTNSVESILKYSKPFEGSCLINLDELPHCDNYKGVQDSLKSLITEDIFICRDMFSVGYEQKNTFNIIITTNNDAISLTQNNNARYVCLDIDESRIGDIDYFQKLSKAINSDHVLEHFYNEMKARFETLKDWNEDIMPFTQSRKLKIIEALPQLYKYIKEQFILKDININMRTDDFLNEYRFITKDKTSNQKLGRMLSSIGITCIKNSGNMGYNYKKTAKELLDIFRERHYIDDEVDFVNKSNSDGVDDEPCMFIKEDDKAVYIRAEDFTNTQKELNKKIDNLLESQETLHDELSNALNYIKQLEKIITEQEQLQPINEDIEQNKIIDESSEDSETKDEEINANVWDLLN